MILKHSFLCKTDTESRSEAMSSIYTPEVIFPRDVWGDLIPHYLPVPLLLDALIVALDVNPKVSYTEFIRILRIRHGKGPTHMLRHLTVMEGKKMVLWMNDIEAQKSSISLVSAITQYKAYTTGDMSVHCNELMESLAEANGKSSGLDFEDLDIEGRAVVRTVDLI